MTIREILNNEVIINNSSSDVYVQSGDFGPCVSYDPAAYVGEDEDGWMQGSIFIEPDEEVDHILTVSEVVEKLSTFDQSYNVVVSDGFEAKPYLIKNFREFANQEQRHAGYKISDERAKQYYGDKKYPLIIFDVEH
ncbi:MAG: hypothetical protein IKK93_00825 [Campylobacter sp.]|nr:hypothetical protein [Campylobacter sp.]